MAVVVGGGSGVEEEAVEDANERESDEDKEGDACLSITVGEVPRVANLEEPVKFFVDCCCLPPLLLLLLPVDDEDDAPNDSNDDDEDGEEDEVVGDLCAWFSIFRCCRDSPEGDLVLVEEALEVREGE